MSAAVVPCASVVTMTATGDIRHLCPFEDEVDYGTISVTWTTNGQTVELHSMAQWFREFRDVKISHEELTDHIVSELRLMSGLTDVTVTTTWETAGMQINCTSGDSRSVFG